MSDREARNSERELIRRVRRGDQKAKEELIRSNQGLVIHIAKRYAFSPDVLPDVIAEGNMGLLKALEKYDEKKNVKFGTYAFFWIKRFVLRAVLREFEIFKIPERIQEIRERMQEVKRGYELRLGRKPTDAELAEELKLPLEIVRKVRKKADQVRIVSSDFRDGEREGNLFDIVDFHTDGDRDLWGVLRNKDILNRIFARIRSREKRANIDVWMRVLELHFGLAGHFPHSYKEIAEELDVSRQRVHQIIKVCLRKLQKEWMEIRHEESGKADTERS